MSCEEVGHWFQSVGSDRSSSWFSGHDLTRPEQGVDFYGSDPGQIPVQIGRPLPVAGP